MFPLLPLAATTGRERRVASNEGPFGEMLANEPLQLQRREGAVVSRAGTLILRAGPWLVPVALVLAWEAAADSGLLAARVLPAPSATVLAAWDAAALGRAADNVAGQHPAAR